MARDARAIDRAAPPPAHTPDPAKARSPPPPPPLPGAILDLADSLLRRLQDLEDYQIPQLAQCRGPVSFHEELAAGVRAELAGCKRDIEELKLEVDDLDKARERAAGGEHVKQVQQRLEGCTKLYRQAVVTSKRQIDASAHLLAREELFASVSGRGSPGPSTPGGGAQIGAGPKQTADDALMSATSDVTEGLRRTLQLMQQEVDRSLVTNEMLQSQTQTMELTSTQYSTLSTLLHTSKTLITSLERADVLDRLLLFFAFAFFAAVCAYIFKKRVVDRGVRVVGGLGGLVVKGGGALAGLSKRQGAADVPLHSELVGEAKEVVRNEVMGEVARATAAAGAAVSAVWAGVEKVRERAFKPAQEEIKQEVPQTFEEIVPRQEEVEWGAEPVRAQPSPSPAKVEVEDNDEDDEFFEFSPDELFDMPTPADSPSPFFDEPDSPVFTVPLESFSDEALVASSAPPLPAPAESTTDDAPPTATPSPSASPDTGSPDFVDQSPLNEVSEPSEGRGLFERGDADAHSAPPDPVSTPAPVQDEEEDVFEPVSLRQEHPPQPTMEHVEDVFDESEAEEIAAEAEEAEQEKQKDQKDEATAETAEDQKVFDRSQYEPFRPTRPDLTEQLGDVNRIVEENAVPPAASSDEPVADLPPSPSLSSLDIPEPTTSPAPSSVPDLVTGIDFPTDYSDIDESAAPLRPVRIPVDEPAPSDSEHVAIVHDAEEAGEPRDVAGVEGITVPLHADEVRADTVPPLDVEEIGEVPVGSQDAGGVEYETELPIDLAAEHTIWEADAQDVSHVAETVASVVPVEDKTEPYVEEEQASEEELLEQMMEQQMGYGGGVSAIAAAKASAPVEYASREPAVAEPAEKEEGAPETLAEQEEQQADFEVHGASESADFERVGPVALSEADSVERAIETSSAATTEEPTAAKTVEPTSLPLDASSATPQPQAPTLTFEAEPESVEEPVDESDDEESAPPAEAEPAATATPTVTSDEQLLEYESAPAAEDVQAKEREEGQFEAEQDVQGETAPVDASAPAAPGESTATAADAPAPTPFPASEADIVDQMITPSPSTVAPVASTIQLITPTATASSAATAPVETQTPVTDSSAAEEAGQAEFDEEEAQMGSPEPIDVLHDEEPEESLDADDVMMGGEALADDDSVEEFEGRAEADEELTEEFIDEDSVLDELDEHDEQVGEQGGEEAEAFEVPRDEL
ncbi:hypothetical protein Rt10032_c11g4614 [Rhodotorula toruloides]|uniref:Sec20 C-terminal domain-containing protein n=1 Tax=Rhodotorula toruloides TaxID=5286 RepID=A0A511KJP0_RHOTO|nr:hypothetical protein Rt10032_c11g4614 [Rhodotorula toruloides]